MINLYKAMGGGWVVEAEKVAVAGGVRRDEVLPQ
jgi:hypothetical protein